MPTLPEKARHPADGLSGVIRRKAVAHFFTSGAAGAGRCRTGYGARSGAAGTVGPGLTFFFDWIVVCVIMSMPETCPGRVMPRMAFMFAPLEVHEGADAAAADP